MLRRFRDEATDVLVATDVAARGLDIERVSHVSAKAIPPAISGRRSDVSSLSG